LIATLRICWGITNVGEVSGQHKIVRSRYWSQIVESEDEMNAV
jgi:hypothetical protein